MTAQGLKTIREHLGQIDVILIRRARPPSPECDRLPSIRRRTRNSALLGGEFVDEIVMGMLDHESFAKEQNSPLVDCARQELTGSST